MFSARLTQAELDDECKLIGESLVAGGVNFLAIDFDRTFIAAHTGGRWSGTAEDLIPHIRPFTHSLIRECYERNIHIAIVTFSGQTKLIRKLLELEFSYAADTIVIKGRDGSWDYSGTEGKLAYMASAAQELMKITGADITPASTLLLDDDTNNVQIAVENDIRAVVFSIHDELSTISELKAIGGVFSSGK